MARLPAFFAVFLISLTVLAAEPQRLRLTAFPSAKALPLHAGAAPRVLLAWEPRAEWDAFFERAQPLERYTERTPTTRDARVSELPANCEWIPDESFGRTVPAGDAAALCRAIVATLADPDAHVRAQAAGERARRLGDEHVEFGRARDLSLAVIAAPR